MATATADTTAAVEGLAMEKDATDPAGTPDRRCRTRAAQRLRPGKLLDRNGGFLGDCAVLDRSGDGARVRLFGDGTLAGDMVLFDESDALSWRVRLVWKNGMQAGLGFVSTPEPVGAREAERIAGRYYAVV